MLIDAVVVQAVLPDRKLHRIWSLTLATSRKGRERGMIGEAETEITEMEKGIDHLITEIIGRKMPGETEIEIGTEIANEALVVNMTIDSGLAGTLETMIVITVERLPIVNATMTTRNDAQAMMMREEVYLTRTGTGRRQGSTDDEEPEN